MCVLSASLSSGGRKRWHRMRGVDKQLPGSQGGWLLQESGSDGSNCWGNFPRRVRLDPNTPCQRLEIDHTDPNGARKVKSESSTLPTSLVWEEGGLPRVPHPSTRKEDGGTAARPGHIDAAACRRRGGGGRLSAGESLRRRPADEPGVPSHRAVSPDAVVPGRGASLASAGGFGPDEGPLAHSSAARTAPLSPPRNRRQQGRLALKGGGRGTTGEGKGGARQYPVRQVHRTSQKRHHAPRPPRDRGFQTVGSVQQLRGQLLVRFGTELQQRAQQKTEDGRRGDGRRATGPGYSSGESLLSRGQRQRQRGLCPRIAAALKRPTSPAAPGWRSFADDLDELSRIVPRREVSLDAVGSWTCCRGGRRRQRPQAGPEKEVDVRGPERGQQRASCMS